MVRAGNQVEVKKILDEKGLEILNIEYKSGLELDRIVELNEENKEADDPNAEDVDNSLENATMTVTPLQLAIIAKRKKVTQVIIEYIANIEEAEECANALKEVLGSTVKLDFVDDKETYDKDDRSMDGMNAFHLACKYDPKAIKLIFDILNRKNDERFFFMMKDLLDETDNHLQQTPLHVASRNSTSVAARYKYV